MEPTSEHARTAYADYRATLEPDTRASARLFDRLETSIKHGEAERFAQRLDAAVPHEGTPTRRAFIGAGVLLAAAAVLAFVLLSPRDGTEVGASATHPQAAATTERGFQALAHHEHEREHDLSTRHLRRPSITPKTAVEPVEIAETHEAGRGSLEPAPELPAPLAVEDASSDLKAELSLVRSARVALRDEAFTRASELLDRHSRAFPEGQLRVEREALRVELACARKDPGADAARSAFLAREPGSHARIRELACQ